MTYTADYTIKELKKMTRDELSDFMSDALKVKRDMKKTAEQRKQAEWAWNDAFSVKNPNFKG